MSKDRKQNRRKRRRDKRDNFKKRPAEIQETKNHNHDELEEEILDLLRAPGAVMLFFDEKGKMKTKIKIEM